MHARTSEREKLGDERRGIRARRQEMSHGGGARYPYGTQAHPTRHGDARQPTRAPPTSERAERRSSGRHGRRHGGGRKRRQGDLEEERERERSADATRQNYGLPRDIRAYGDGASVLLSYVRNGLPVPMRSNRLNVICTLRLVHKHLTEMIKTEAERAAAAAEAGETRAGVMTTDGETMVRIRNMFELYRLAEEDGLTDIRQSMLGAETIAATSVVWLIVLQMNVLIYGLWEGDDGEAEGGETHAAAAETDGYDRDMSPTDVEFLRKNMLCSTDGRIADMTMGEVSMAIDVLVRYLAEADIRTQRDTAQLARYLKHLEIRLARLIIYPSTADLMDCYHMRTRLPRPAPPRGEDGPSAVVPLFRVSWKKISTFAAIFSSIRGRIWRFSAYTEAPFRLDTDERYARFKAYFMDRAKKIAAKSKEYLNTLNDLLIKMGVDLAHEKVCRYLDKTHVDQTSVMQVCLTPQEQRVRYKIREEEDMYPVLGDPDDLAQMIASKTDVLGSRKTWQNDVILLMFVDMLFQNGYLSHQKPLWRQSYVYLELDHLPDAIKQREPRLVQMMGRFDLVYRGKVYRTRSAFKAFFLWCVIMYKLKGYGAPPGRDHRHAPPPPNDSTTALELDRAVFDDLMLDTGAEEAATGREAYHL